jgi:glutamate racemase
MYLGDNARVPYGEKSPAKIYEYSQEAMDFLFESGCNLIIIACNTASAQALERLQKEWLPKHYPDRKILGVIRPLAEYAAKSNCKRVGVIGTKSTIKSGAYNTEIKKINPKIDVMEKSAPLLVPLIEEGWSKKPETKMILKKYLRPLKEGCVKMIILACTHYPFLLADIKRISGRKINVPDPGKIIAESLKEYLSRHEELGLIKDKKAGVNFFATDHQTLFKELGGKFLGQEITDLHEVKLS